MLENKLFQVQKSALVDDALTDLYQCLPRTLTKFCLTFEALLVSYDKGCSERLLQNSALLDFFLNGKADLQSHGVRFRPNPTRIDEPDSLAVVLGGFEAVHIIEAESHEFSTLQFAGYPLSSFLVPSLASSTLMQCSFCTDPLCDIRCTGKACSTSIGLVGGDWNTAHTTKDGDHITGPSRQEHGLRARHLFSDLNTISASRLVVHREGQDNRSVKR